MGMKTSERMSVRLLLLLFALSLLQATSAFRRAFNYNHQRSQRVISRLQPLQDSEMPPESTSESIIKRSLLEQAASTTTSMASAAVVAAAAVNSAVGLRDLSSTGKEATHSASGKIDENSQEVDGISLPSVYDYDLIEGYWQSQGGALTQRWSEFLGFAVPYLTRLVTFLIVGGPEEVKRNSASLSKEARIISQKLGPTYVKLAQSMSIRPDVLPVEALDELKFLNESVMPFDTQTAVAQIEEQLGGDLGSFFTEISEMPVDVGCHSQVYKAKLLSGEYVAVKVQRPSILDVVTKDLYVLRRAAEVYQSLIERFAPQQKADYVELLNKWAMEFYAELDFTNEAANQMRLGDLVRKEGISGIYVPRVYADLSTQKILVTEWVDGIKFSECTEKEIASLIPDTFESYVAQFLQLGLVHTSPHPDNLIMLHEARGLSKIALVDYASVTCIEQIDTDRIISAIVHLGNADYAALVDDFISLEILSKDCDADMVVTSLEAALAPYVSAKRSRADMQANTDDLKEVYNVDGGFPTMSGGFQQMALDTLAALADVPLSITPNLALLGRAVGALEGIALVGNPNYRIIMEAYPFIARRLLSDDGPKIQESLQEILYTRKTSDFAVDSCDETTGMYQTQRRMKASRLAALLNAALGRVRQGSGGAFVDFDAVPQNSIDIPMALRHLLSERTGSLRAMLVTEAVNAADILIRQAARKSFTQIFNRAANVPVVGRFLPNTETVPLPFVIPIAKEGFMRDDDTGESAVNVDDAFTGASEEQPAGRSTGIGAVLETLGDVKFATAMLTPAEVLEAVAPGLSEEEELYAASLKDLAVKLLGEDAGVVVNGDVIVKPIAAARFFLSFAATGNLPLPIVNSPIVSNLSGRFLDLLRDTGKDTTETSKETGIVLAAGAEKGVETVMEGVGDLDSAEMDVFRSTTAKVLRKLSVKILRRLEVLA